jgi:hypothetical protein
MLCRPLLVARATGNVSAGLGVVLLAAKRAGDIVAPLH